MDSYDYANSRQRDGEGWLAKG
jgi:hypothetical protein